MECLSQGKPIDLLLLDLLMPGMEGVKGVEEICHSWPDVPIIIVSVKEDIGTIRDALAAGAMGYIPKTSMPNVTTSAIKLVLSGGVYVPPHILRFMGDPGSNDQGDAAETSASDGKGRFGLTSRQIEVLNLIGLGKSNKAIAEELGLTAGTVKMHTSRIFKVLEVENRTEAAAKFNELKKNAEML